MVTPEPETPDLPRRLAIFRHEAHLAAQHLTRDGIDGAIALARELELREHDIQSELEELRACADALDLADDITRGAMPIVDTHEPLPAGDVCHFATPVRFGRRRTDQFGHLELTNARLKFRAALDVSVAWTEIGHIHRVGRELVIGLADSARLLRFWCPSVADAARAAVFAEHFARTARSRTSSADTTYHAWVLPGRSDLHSALSSFACAPLARHPRTRCSRTRRWSTRSGTMRSSGC
jgi:hypothetical protein